MPVRIIENSWLASLAARLMKAEMLAMTWGERILLYNTSREQFLADPRWVRHELCHVAQFREHGFFLFLVKYAWESFRKGYYNNRFEREARAAESVVQPIHSISPD